MTKGFLWLFVLRTSLSLFPLFGYPHGRFLHLGFWKKIVRVCALVGLILLQLHDVGFFHPPFSGHLDQEH